MKRVLMLPAVVLVVLFEATAPAAAHEEISPSSVGTGRSAFLTFTAANERQTPLTSVTLAAPAGLVLGPVTREPQGWTAVRGPEGITWSGGPLPAGKFEQWGVELEAPDLPGTFTFRSTLRFADGRTDSHDVPLTVVSANTPASAPPASAAASTTVAATPSTPSDSDGDVASARRQANLALGVGAGGLVLGLVGLLLVPRRARAGGPPAPPREQEW